MKIYVDFRKLNVGRKKNLYLLPFTYKVINTIVGHKFYTFLDEFQDIIKYQLHPKISTKLLLRQIGGAFVWVVMPFGVKNGSPTYQRVVIKAFHEYIGVFMKIFLDDFTIFSDMSTHLEKLKKCFIKCREFNISLNPDKCAFMLFLKTILGFIVSKKGKSWIPKRLKI